MAADPIDLAVKRAEAAEAEKPKRFGGTIQLPSGQVAMLDLPAPFQHTDALALLKAVAEFALQAPQEKTPEQAARDRLVLPAH